MAPPTVFEVTVKVLSEAKLTQRVLPTLALSLRIRNLFVFYIEINRGAVNEEGTSDNEDDPTATPLVYDFNGAGTRRKVIEMLVALISRSRPKRDDSLFQVPPRSVFLGADQSWCDDMRTPRHREEDVRCQKQSDISGHFVTTRFGPILQYLILTLFFTSHLCLTF